MKLLFISDIHGIKTNLEKIRERFIKLNCDKLVVLGDLYYTNPSDRLNEEIDTEYVRKFLESFKNKLICVRGNCDSQIDIQTSDFPVIDGLHKIQTINEELYINHGHIYNERNWQKEHTYLIYGHYHCPFIKEIETNTYINPGSISLPRTSDGATYLYYDEEKFIIFNIKDEIIAKKDIKS